MAAKGRAKEAPLVKELVMTRVFDAPRELVWKAWTDEKMVARWWGPHGFTLPVCKMDVRPGGKIVMRMEGEGFPPNPIQGLFKEVVKPEKLSFSTEGFSMRRGNRAS